MSEILKSRHAFGSEANVDSALEQGLIDAYDILFLEEGKIGWITADGEKVIVDNADELAELEAQLKEQIDTKADAKEVEEKIDTAVSDAVTSVKSYTDDKVEAAINEHIVKKYEFDDVPTGTLIDYGENEIRIMCPANSEWHLQNVGIGGDPNTYYATFKTYVPNDDVAGYIEHLNGQSDAEILTEFSTDKYGRRYQPTWFGLAIYDSAADSWTYYGSLSSKDRYIGWDYQIDWYNADGVMIDSDCIRINLSNEDCHSTVEPYYVGKIMKDVELKIEERVKEVEVGYEIVEF